MSEQSENIYINLVKNPKWDGVESNQPVYVGPPNVEAQQKGKNWTIGVKINGMWYNQAAFPTKDKDGNKVAGGLTIKLTPSGAGKAKNDFASASSNGNDDYTF
jgi:hypothetical protein